MPTLTHESWKLWFSSLPENEEGNRNMAAFSTALNAGKSAIEKIKNLTDNQNNVFLLVDGTGLIKVYHSPKNFGGTLLRPSNKVACLTGLGRSAICVQLNVASAFADCKMNTPSSEELAACTTAENVRDFPIPAAEPDEEGDFTYEGSNIMLPAPWLRDTIMNADTQSPFELIPIVLAAAHAYDEAHPDLANNDRAISHADDFCSWAWGAGVHRVPETRLEIDADDEELEAYRIARHMDCITGAFINNGNAGVAAAGAATAATDNIDVLKQLTASIARQSEEAATSNQLRKDEIERKREHDDEKKDRTKKYLHTSTIRMLVNASATSKLEVDTELTQPCRKFLNASSQGHAEQELHHQFNSLNLTDVCFAPGTVQNLYLGEFIYGNSSAPSNFTVFAFFEQPPLSNAKQENYLTCHLIHENGQKQSLDEIKASMKQEVIVPKEYATMVIQFQYFVGAVEIFFGSESILRIELNKLLHKFGAYKKQFRDMIALDEWFPCRFLFAIDRRVQIFLSECKVADSRMDVNDRHLDFTDIIESTLYGSFTMRLPPTFQRTSSDDSGEKRSSNNAGADAGSKKRKTGKAGEEKKEQGKPVKNDSQHEAFKMKPGETWKKTFKKAQVDHRPSWNGVKSKQMCIKFHIEGSCFTTCDRVESHVPKDQIPAEKVTEMCSFIAKCRGE